MKSIARSSGLVCMVALGFAISILCLAADAAAVLSDEQIRVTMLKQWLDVVETELKKMPESYKSDELVRAVGFMKGELIDLRDILGLPLTDEELERTTRRFSMRQKLEGAKAAHFGHESFYEHVPQYGRFK